MILKFKQLYFQILVLLGLRKNIRSKFQDSKGRPVDITQTSGGYEEAYVYEAHYLDIDSEDEVPDHELEYLTETYAEYCMDREFQNQVMEAEYAFEGDK